MLQGSSTFFHKEQTFTWSAPFLPIKKVRDAYWIGLVTDLLFVFLRFKYGDLCRELFGHSM